MVGNSVSLRNQAKVPPWLPGTITNMISLQRCIMLLNDECKCEMPH